ncbi:hypothetical protein KJI95_09475 [Shewanella sp. JM162201]|uniref:Uncharacterized protein n=1 Tax=Shewanella jiangmenensis TaxID=2837387 RepID=A0ABS5V2W0_9GAMM|nr:hypothetical protein [Shewanella jiangmenensis]MBT1444750.1 hypothetical protein [Shewanella jiangmenensis]
MPLSVRIGERLLVPVSAFELVSVGVMGKLLMNFRMSGNAIQDNSHVHDPD